LGKIQKSILFVVCAPWIWFRAVSCIVKELYFPLSSPACESESAIKHATGFKMYKSLLKVAKCVCLLRSWLSYLSYCYLICSEIKCMCGKYYLKIWSFITSAIFPYDVIYHMDTFTSSCLITFVSFVLTYAHVFNRFYL